MKDDIKQLKDDINDIRSNHLAHIEPDISKIKTDIDWLKKFQWLILVAALSPLVAKFFN